MKKENWELRKEMYINLRKLNPLEEKSKKRRFKPITELEQKMNGNKGGNFKTETTNRFRQKKKPLKKLKPEKTHPTAKTNPRPKDERETPKEKLERWKEIWFYEEAFEEMRKAEEKEKSTKKEVDLNEKVRPIN